MSAERILPVDDGFAQRHLEFREWQLEVGMARCTDYSSPRMMQAALLMRHRADAFVEAVDSGSHERIAKRLRKLRHSYAICVDAVKGPDHEPEQEVEVLRREHAEMRRQRDVLRDHVRFVRRETGFQGEYRPGSGAS